MLRRLKSMPMVFRASQEHFNLDIKYICNLIKIPTASYVNATLKRWGRDFTRNGGDIQNLKPMGKIQMSRGKPIKLLTTHFVLCAQSSKSG